MPGSIKNPPGKIWIQQMMMRRRSKKEREGGGINQRISRRRSVQMINDDVTRQGHIRRRRGCRIVGGVGRQRGATQAGGMMNITMPPPPWCRHQRRRFMICIWQYFSGSGGERSWRLRPDTLSLRSPTLPGFICEIVVVIVIVLSDDA